MHPLDPIRYLFGHKAAIERIAANYYSLFIGAVLVVTAGIARNYDAVALRHEWKWLTGPFSMSLFSSVLIYGFLRVFIKLKDRRWNFLTFLSCFWLTAPCAWIYGLPVERWMSLMDATKCNFTFLGIVSLWRVVLMARATAVVTGASFSFTCALILMPAAVEMLCGTVLNSISLTGMMSGSRLPPHHAWLRQASAITFHGSIVVFVIASGLAALFGINGTKNEVPVRPHLPMKPGAWWFPVLSLVAWAFIAVREQPAVERKHQLTQLIAAQRYPEAVAYAGQFQPADFPPATELPPGNYNSPYAQTDQLVGLLTAHTANDPAWLREAWITEAKELATLLYGFNHGPKGGKDLFQLPEMRTWFQAQAAIAETVTEDKRTQWQQSLLEYVRTPPPAEALTPPTLPPAPPKQAP